MKVKVIVTTNDEYRRAYELEIDGKEAFSVWEGEPEDATLGSDFNDVYKLPDLMRMAYEAGQRGEEFIFEEMEVDET